MTDQINFSEFLRVDRLSRFTTNKEKIDFHYKQIKQRLQRLGFVEKYNLQALLEKDFSFENFLIVGEALKSFFALEPMAAYTPISYDLSLLVYHFCEAAEACEDARCIPVLEFLSDKLRLRRNNHDSEK